MADWLEFDVRFRAGARKAPTRDDGTPIRILICGDVSGRAARGLLDDAEALATRPLLSLDLDSVHHAMRRLDVRVPISMSEQPTPDLELAIGSLDDFHPDALCRHVAALELLCILRRRLIDPRTAPGAIGSLTVGSPAPTADGEMAAIPATAEDDSSVLNRLLGARPSAPAVLPPGAMASVDEIVRRAVAGHVMPAADPRQKALVASVDEVLGQSMRRLLHQPAFQRIEAAWRSLHWLVINVGPAEDLNIMVLDVRKEELAADLRRASSLEDSGIHRRLAYQAPWSLVVGDYAFGPGEEDATLLAALGALAASVGGPFLASADDTLVGCQVPQHCSSPSRWAAAESEDAGAFRALRRSAGGPFVGLTWPRWLLRTPYGARRDPVESFAFEELDGPPVHAQLVWGHTAFAAAAVIASSLRDEDTTGQQGSFEIGDLPLYAFEEDGEPQMQPCAECWLSEPAVEAALARGVMPVVSLRGRNAVRLVRLQSIAEPRRPLAGLGGRS